MTVMLICARISSALRIASEGSTNRVGTLNNSSLRDRNIIHVPVAAVRTTSDSAGVQICRGGGGISGVIVNLFRQRWIFVIFEVGDVQ